MRFVLFILFAGCSISALKLGFCEGISAKQTPFAPKEEKSCFKECAGAFRVLCALLGDCFSLNCCDGDTYEDCVTDFNYSLGSGSDED